MNEAKPINNRLSLNHPPQAVSRAKLDNLALVPGSLLSQKDKWRGLLDELPAGSRLIILPSADSSARRTLQKVSSSLQAKGKRVTTVSADSVSSPASTTQLGFGV